MLTNDQIDEWLKGAENGIADCDEQHAQMLAEWDDEDGERPPEVNDCPACASDRIAVAAIRQLRDELAAVALKQTISGE